LHGLFALPETRWERGLLRGQIDSKAQRVVRGVAGPISCPATPMKN
jgi:hypothetical protein